MRSRQHKPKRSRCKRLIPPKLGFHPHIDIFISPNVEPLLNSLLICFTSGSFFLETVKKKKGEKISILSLGLFSAIKLNSRRSNKALKCI